MDPHASALKMTSSKLPSSRQLAAAITRAESRYLARLSPGRRGSLTTVAARILFQALAKDVKEARSFPPRRRTTFTRTSLREMVRNHPDLRNSDFLSSSFNTTPEELAELIAAFSFEDELAGRLWTFKFAGPTKSARAGEGAKEEIYLVATIEEVSSLGREERKVARPDEAPRGDDPLALFQTALAGGAQTRTALARAADALRGLPMVKLVYLRETIRVDVDARGDATITHAITAANLDDVSAASDLQEIWFETPEPTPFPISLNAKGARSRMRMVTDDPCNKQFAVDFYPPIPALGTRKYEISYPCREMRMAASWGLKIRRAIHELRLEVTDRRRGRLADYGLETQGPGGLVRESHPDISVSMRAGVTRLAWAHAFPVIGAYYRLHWKVER